VIQKIQSAEQEIRFVYEDGLLTGLSDGNDTTLHKFSYTDTEMKRLVSHVRGDQQFERVFRYDAAGKILYKYEAGEPVLYDWKDDGTVTMISGDALIPWRNVENPKILLDLTVTFRLMHDHIVDRVLFVRQVKDELVVTVDDQSFTLPSYMVQNPQSLRSKLSPYFDSNQPGQMVLISTEGVQGIAFQTLLKDSIPLTAENIDEARIRANINLLRNPDGFTAVGSSVLNGIPAPAETNKPQLWYNEEQSQTWRESFGNLLTETGSNISGITSRSATSEQVRKALTENLSVLIVVAHSDGKQIYLPNNESFALSSLSDAEKQIIAEKKPLVILLSCDTAAREGVEASFAQRLLEIGPRAVIAPNGEIKVTDAYQILQHYLRNSKNIQNPLQAIFDALKEVFPELQIPKPEQQEYSVEILVFDTQPDMEENKS
jgi:hypothetical protein